MSELLTDQLLEDFDRDGVIVVEDVFSPEEIANIRDNFHQQLKIMGIDHEKVLSGEANMIGNARIKSDISRIFYNKWKIDAHLDKKVYEITKKLLMKTYGDDNNDNFKHIYGKFNDILCYIDRVCYRLPDHIREEGGLGLHMDYNPKDPYLLSSGGQKKWRPIQSFIALTDHYSGDSGGLKVVKGFHKKVDEYFKGLKVNDGEMERGEFYRMNNGHDKLQKECQPLIIPAGSLVLWDSRLPHATTKKFNSYDSREVIYNGFLPNIKLNVEYVKKQAKNIISKIAPPAYNEIDGEICDRNWNIEQLTEIQKKTLGI